MGCTFEMNGYTNFKKLGQDIAKLLAANGFTLKYPGIGQQITDTTTKFTLETSNVVDPLSTATNAESTAQPWRIHIDVSDDITMSDPGTLRVYVATPLQLNDDGEVTWEYPGQQTTGTTDGMYKRKSGELIGGYYTTDITNASGQISIPFASKNFSVDLKKEALKNSAAAPVSNTLIDSPEYPDTGFQYIGGQIEAHPYSFRLTISDHGIALVVWEEGTDLWGDKFSWFVVQRPVNSETGQPLVVKDANSRCPVFCVYSIGGGKPDAQKLSIFSETAIASSDAWASQLDQKPARIYRFTVREIDVNRPSVPVLATIDTPDSKSIINAVEQVSITEGNQYVISFMKGFNTARYMYNEEIDLITYTSADVISQHTDISIQPYKNPNNNNAPITVKYKAMQANLPDNSGMRILIAVDGQGVSGNCTGL